MIIVRIVQFVKIVQLVQLDYYGYIKFFGAFVGTWGGAFTLDNREWWETITSEELLVTWLVNDKALYGIFNLDIPYKA